MELKPFQIEWKPFRLAAAAFDLARNPFCDPEGYSNPTV